MRIFITVFALCLALATLATAKDKKKEKPTAQIDFVVVRENDAKPVRSASVIVHTVSTEGHQGKDSYEMKTNGEGKVTMFGLDYGKYRIQVLAPHYQTYGADMDVTEPQREMTIKLKPPQSQYSIY